jgi:hypothetical protein
VGKPRSKQIEELADRWSFLFANLMDSARGGAEPV